MKLINFLDRNIQIERNYLENLESYVLKKDKNTYEIHISCADEDLIKVLSHETWHLFTDILSNLDSGDIKINQLSSDIYAYNFENLFWSIYSLLK